VKASCYKEQKRDLFNAKEDENGFFYEYAGTEGKKQSKFKQDCFN